MTTTVNVKAVGDTNDSPAALRLTGVSKSFPGIQALRGINLQLNAGEIHGLVGENGAGKSTLAKIVSGAIAPDQGVVELGAIDLTNAGPRQVAEAGVSMVYQDSTIVPELSAAANAFLSHPVTHGPVLAKRERARRFAELADQLGIDIDGGERAGSLSIVKQRLLAVMSAVLANCRLLIMDEPTAALGPTEREMLFETIAKLQAGNVTILYISHDLDEVLSLCDRVSVMRDGTLVATRASADWTARDLVTNMLGRAVERMVRRPGSGVGEEVLSVRDLSVPGTLHEISLTVHAGEILGIAGLVGAGRSTLLRAIAGAEQSARGSMRLSGAEIPWPRSVPRAMRHGIVLSPEDRKGDGLVLSMSGAMNVVMSDMGPVATGPIVTPKRVRKRAADLVSRLGFRVDRLRADAGTLSGGNQQKLVVAKCMNREPTLLLLDEPTTGIDVGAKADVFAAMAELVSRGKAIIFTSAEIEEVVDQSDRVVVLSAGRQTGEVRADDATVERVLQLAFRLVDADSKVVGGGEE